MGSSRATSDCVVVQKNDVYTYQIFIISSADLICMHDQVCFVVLATMLRSNVFIRKISCILDQCICVCAGNVQVIYIHVQYDEIMNIPCFNIYSV